jgi:2-hydroxy-3-keto-5-methylthiopentenyl-1-phosphate phosphatase
MNAKSKFDFWYAVNNTEIVVLPSSQLETFGATMLNYHLVSELMDSTTQVRIREGRMQASRPEIITPTAYSKFLLEGFGEEAGKYLDWLKEHESDIRILQYGYQLKQESFSEHLVSDNLKTVVERVSNEVRQKADPCGAVVQGVDDPWDVCLIKLFREVIQKSAKRNFQELATRHMFDTTDGVPRGIREELESLFLAASRDAGLLKKLAAQLHHHGLFSRYEDRFYAVVKSHQR